MGVSPMSQMPPLPLLESRACGDTKVMVLVGSRGGNSSLEIIDLGVCSYFKIAVSCGNISPASHAAKGVIVLHEPLLWREEMFEFLLDLLTLTAQSGRAALAG